MEKAGAEALKGEEAVLWWEIAAEEGDQNRGIDSYWA